MEYPKTTKNVGQPCAICGQPANAQATVEALQRELANAKACSEKNWADGAKEAVAARTLRLELDAERERSKRQAEEAMVMFAKLSQLQALVRPFAELAKHLDGREFNTLHAILRNGTWIKVTMDDFMALKAATLPATPTERGENHSGDDTDMVQQGGGDGE